MKIFFAADHAGYEMKNALMEFVREELNYEVEDCGAFELDEGDDYPDFVVKAAVEVARDPKGSRAIVLGASGQGEAMVANRQPGVRAAVYYGEPAVKQIDASGNELNLLESTRAHNDANVLALGAKFLNLQKAKSATELWLKAKFSGEERHQRRIEKLS